MVLIQTRTLAGTDTFLDIYAKWTFWEDFSENSGKLTRFVSFIEQKHLLRLGFMVNFVHEQNDQT